MIQCIQCPSLSTIPIVYGEPGPSLMEAASRGLAELGGCLVSDTSPTRRCLVCGSAWIDPETSGPDSTATARLGVVREIVSQHLFPIHAGMVASDLFCDDWQADTNDLQSTYAYVQLKEMLGIRGGCTRAQVENVHQFKNANPEYYNQVIQALQKQVCRLSTRSRSPGGFDSNLYRNLFQACALMFNASPMSRGDADEEFLRSFLRTISRGWLGFE